MLADPTNDVRGSLQIEFKWHTVGDLIFMTQDELLVELQNGKIFNHRVPSTALA
jgi:hypothetical protein